MEAGSTTETLSRWYSFRFRLIMQGILIGIVAGLVVVAYRFSLEKALHLLNLMYALIRADPWMLLPWSAALIAVALIVGKLIQAVPMISGSGIPQTEGFLLGKLDMCWWKVLLAKFTGGVLTIGGGLSLGREGPSVQLGSAIGLGVGTLLKRKKVEEKYLVTAGASAGLAAAFNAPLAGVLFALEEVHKSFSPLVLLTALSAALTAAFVSGEFFGLTPVFTFTRLSALPPSNYLYIIVLGVITGLTGALFNSALLRTQKLYASQTWLKKQHRVIVPLFSSVALGLFLPQVLGGGHELIVELIGAHLPLTLIGILLVAKFLFTMLSYGSGAPGGIFLPLLCIGALIGNGYGALLEKFAGLDAQYINTFIVLAMAGYFTAIVRAPITGIILITEMTGSFSYLLPIALISIVAYIIADLCSSRPIYESLLKNILRASPSPADLGDDQHKALLEIPVCPGSFIDGRTVKDVNWPAQCLLVSVKRGTHEIIPKGSTEILSGDYLTVLTNENLRAAVQDQLAEFSGSCEDPL